MRMNLVEWIFKQSMLAPYKTSPPPAQSHLGFVKRQSLKIEAERGKFYNQPV